MCGGIHPCSTGGVAGPAQRLQTASPEGLIIKVVNSHRGSRQGLVSKWMCDLGMESGRCRSLMPEGASL